jgi:hypothetical protein
MIRTASVVLFAACAGEDDPATDEDSDVSPPADCGATVATGIHGETAADSISPGDTVAIVSGPQGGFHMELGMEVESDRTDVAWRIDLYEVDTEVLVGSVGQTVFTLLTAWDDSTCVGHLNGRVFIGDGTAQTADFACALAGTAVEARGWAAPLEDDGEIPVESTEVTLEIVAGVAPAC